MCVCVFFPFILDIKFVGRTSRGHTGGRSHMIFHPSSFCGACLNFFREKDSAIPFPRRPWSRILCANDLLIVLHPLGIFFFFLQYIIKQVVVIYHTTIIGAWVNSKMSGRNATLYPVLYNHINRHAGTPNTKTKGTISWDTTAIVLSYGKY